LAGGPAALRVVVTRSPRGAGEGLVGRLARNERDAGRASRTSNPPDLGRAEKSGYGQRGMSGAH
jgi:hypothetical protein